MHRVPEIIAEVGSAHGGDIDVALSLVRELAGMGADTYKVQIIFADEILHPRYGYVTINGRSTNLYADFQKLEQPIQFYERIYRECGRLGISFLASVFGTRSLDIALKLGCRRIKIASPELNHIPLLQEVAGSGCSVILSTGVSRVGDIELAVGQFPRGRCTLLHCVTAYPAPPQEYNLRLIETLGGLFSLPVGVSDHSSDPFLVPLLSVHSGAAVIEKHIVPEHTHQQLDDAVALLPTQFAELCRRVRDAAGVPAEVRMQSIIAEYGAKLVTATLGDGQKRLAPREAENYGRSNRCIRAITDIRAGETLSEKNCAILRGEGEPAGSGISDSTDSPARGRADPGCLHPRQWALVLGAVARKNIGDGQRIRLDHISSS